MVEFHPVIQETHICLVSNQVSAVKMGLGIQLGTGVTSWLFFQSVQRDGITVVVRYHKGLLTAGTGCCSKLKYFFK